MVHPGVEQCKPITAVCDAGQPAIPHPRFAGEREDPEKDKAQKHYCNSMPCERPWKELRTREVYGVNPPGSWNAETCLGRLCPASWLVRPGVWYWKDDTNTLQFASSSPAAEKNLKEGKNTLFQEICVRTLKSVFQDDCSSKLPERKLVDKEGKLHMISQWVKHEYVTLDDVKYAALLLKDTHESRHMLSLEVVMGNEKLDDFLMALLFYISFYLEKIALEKKYLTYVSNNIGSSDYVETDFLEGWWQDPVPVATGSPNKVASQEWKRNSLGAAVLEGYMPWEKVKDKEATQWVMTPQYGAYHLLVWQIENQTETKRSSDLLQCFLDQEGSGVTEDERTMGQRSVLISLQLRLVPQPTPRVATMSCSRALHTRLESSSWEKPSLQRDRSYFEGFYNFSSYVTWLVFRRKHFQVIREEIGRLLFSDVFNPALRGKKNIELQKQGGGTADANTVQLLYPRKDCDKHPSISTMIQQRSPVLSMLLPLPKDSAQYLFQNQDCQARDPQPRTCDDLPDFSELFTSK
ncbi:protein phosphatase 1 regulatory subunit 36 [Guaruba guarouba]